MRKYVLPFDNVTFLFAPTGTALPHHRGSLNFCYNMFWASLPKERILNSRPMENIGPEELVTLIWQSRLVSYAWCKLFFIWRASWPSCLTLSCFSLWFRVCHHGVMVQHNFDFSKGGPSYFIALLFIFFFGRLWQNLQMTYVWKSVTLRSTLMAVPNVEGCILNSSSWSIPKILYLVIRYSGLFTVV